MHDDDEPIGICTASGHVSTFGYLRRKDMETPARKGEVWEAPDGALTIFPPDSTLTLVRVWLNPPGWTKNAAS